MVGELWRDLVDLLTRRPLLWVPVLVADLLAYLVNLGRNGFMRAVILHRTVQHSALGGAVVHAPMSASAMESTTILALLLSWLTYFIRILLYAGAFVATAALVKGAFERLSNPATEIAPSLLRQRGGILELALRALSVYAIVALLFSWVSPYLARHGHKDLFKSAWIDFGLTLLVPVVLAFLLPPVALRILSGRQPEKALAGISQQFALILVFVASLLALFVNSNSRQLEQVSAGARYPLEIVGSLLIALPYVLLFTGIAILARRIPGAEE